MWDIQCGGKVPTSRPLRPPKVGNYELYLKEGESRPTQMTTVNIK
jgi:hypothetical protein